MRAISPTEVPLDVQTCVNQARIPTSLTLAVAIDHALCANPRIRRAWINVHSQAAVLGEARSAYLPQVAANGNFGDLNQKVSFPNLREFDSNFTAKTGDDVVGLTWVLYDFGLRSANSRLARALIAAANMSQDAEVHAALFEVAQKFIEVQAADALLLSSIESENLALRNLNGANATYSSGMVPIADTLQAQTAFAQASLKHIQAESDQKTAMGNLAVLLGASADAIFELPGIAPSEPDRSTFENSVTSLIEEALHTHPRILAALAQHEAALAQTDALRAQGRPTLSFVAGLEHNETPLTVSQQENFNNRTIGLAIKVPLFEGFYRKYKVREAQLQEASSAADVEEARQLVTLEIWSSYQGLQRETASLQAVEAVLKNARKALEVSHGQYDAGYGSIFDEIQDASVLANAEQQRILSLARWHIARIRLATSLARLTPKEIE